MILYLVFSCLPLAVLKCSDYLRLPCHMGRIFSSFHSIVYLPSLQIIDLKISILHSHFFSWSSMVFPHPCAQSYFPLSTTACTPPPMGDCCLPMPGWALWPLIPCSPVQGIIPRSESILFFLLFISRCSRPAPLHFGLVLGDFTWQIFQYNDVQLTFGDGLWLQQAGPSPAYRGLGKGP